MQKRGKGLQFIKTYDVMQISNVYKLTYPVAVGSTIIRYYVIKEEIFDIIHESHINTGHGGRNKMYEEVQKKYKNLTQEHIFMYLAFCESCLKKSSILRNGIVVKPMVFREMNSRGQVDFIDIQSQADADYKCILVY